MNVKGVVIAAVVFINKGPVSNVQQHLMGGKITETMALNSTFLLLQKHDET